jgi:hypothetical protein
VVDEPVVGSAEQRMAGGGTVAGAVDQRLRVLDANADRERLRLEVDPSRLQHRERVACAVTGCDDDVLGRDLRAPAFAIALARALDDDAAHRAVLDRDIDDAGREPDLAAEALDLRAHPLDHRDEAERCRCAAWRPRRSLPAHRHARALRSPCGSGGEGR